MAIVASVSVDSPLVAFGREVLQVEAAALGLVAARLDAGFERAVGLVLACEGRVVLSGMGKAGIIAQKISATLASTGTVSHFLHPAEALHGDLGRVARGDLVVALSNSGETEELNQLLPTLRELGVPIVALTATADSTLGRAADVVIALGNLDEACPLGLAPTTSALALLAVGDALSMAVLRERPFSQDDYARIHPAGKLGRRLRKVSEMMRRGVRNPVVSEAAPLTEALRVMTQTPGRPGATNVVDAEGRLTGLFTDGDLRRLVQAGLTDFSAAVATVMHRGPMIIDGELRATEAARIMRERQFDQLPVVDEHGRPVGLLDVQDLLAARVVD
jgi:arabinose-5-phosphate isomerase